MRELNLLPKSYSKSGTATGKNNGLLLVLLAVVVVFGGSFTFVKIREVSLKSEKNKLQQELALRQEKVKELNNLEEEIKLTEQHIQIAKSLSTVKEKDTDKIIEEVIAQSKKQGGMELTSIEYLNAGFMKDECSFKIEGKAKNEWDVSKFWANLREDKKFKISHISSYKAAEKGGGYTFSGTITVKGGTNNGEN